MQVKAVTREQELSGGIASGIYIKSSCKLLNIQTDQCQTLFESIQCFSPKVHVPILSCDIHAPITDFKRIPPIGSMDCPTVQWQSKWH